MSEAEGEAGGSRARRRARNRRQAAAATAEAAAEEAPAEEGGEREEAGAAAPEADAEAATAEAGAETAVAKRDAADISKLLNFDLRVAMEVFSFQKGGGGAAREPAAAARTFQFWSTQPVPRMDEKVSTSEPIEPDREPGEVRAEPYSLPDGFRWDTLDLERADELRELYALLNENYVEDDDCMFRFDYQAAFLQWAMRPPGWRRAWHCGVRVAKSGRLVGFISAVPAQLRIYGRPRPVAEINFLCVHKKLRSKRVAPVLIREITRRVNLTGVFQGVYTAGKVLPKPIATCRYWHRSLNPRKLIEIEFSRLTRNMTMQRTLKLYRLADSPRTPGFRRLRAGDCAATLRLLSTYLEKFDLAPVYSADEFRHWFVPEAGIVDSFVVESAAGEITDFVSYYSLPSTVINHPTHKTLKAAYSFYNVSTATPWVELMTDALISAKNSGFDVFNALDLMDNREFLSPLKFGIGDGNLQYYLYNWRCPPMAPGKVGLVLQ